MIQRIRQSRRAVGFEASVCNRPKIDEIDLELPHSFRIPGVRNQPLLSSPSWVSNSAIHAAVMLSSVTAWISGRIAPDEYDCAMKRA